MVQHLRLKWTPDHLPIRGTNGSNSYSKMYVDTIISSSFETQFEMPARFRIVPKITSSQLPPTINTQGWTNLDGVPLADPEFYRPGKIDVLLGAHATMRT